MLTITNIIESIDVNKWLPGGSNMWHVQYFFEEQRQEHEVAIFFTFIREKIVEMKNKV